MSPDIPKFPDFRKITLEDRPVFMKMLSSLEPATSEMTFTNFYIWRSCDRSLVTSINGNLCVVAYPENESAYFFEPIGSNMMEGTIDACMSYVPRMSRVSEGTISKYFQNKGKFKIEKDNDNSDYLYDREDLANLKGRKFDGKRNRIKKFLKNNASEFTELSMADTAECLGLLKRWKETRKAGACFDEPIREALMNFTALELKGALVKVNGRIEAFTIGEKLNKDTAIVYIEVANPAFEGIAQYINQRFCSDQWTGIRSINREQDLGDPGLRRAKISYHPIQMIDKYTVTFMD